MKQSLLKSRMIADFLKQPIKKGDWFNVQGTNSRAPEQWAWANYVSGPDEEGFLTLMKETSEITRHISEVERVTDYVGMNPFMPEIRTTGYQVDIEQLLWRAGYQYNSGSRTGGEEGIIRRSDSVDSKNKKQAPEVCDNPMVINEDGEEVEYQRGLVWTVYQKKLLINSIWNHIEIGKVVLRLRPFHWVTERINDGKIEHTAFADLVDGKQRVNALVSYIKGEFSDMEGIYWQDLSENAKRQFLSYRGVTYVELDEKTSDKETLAAFLAINFTGTPMSKKHIQYVQKIKI
jgi:hypothetical protein